MIGLPKITCLYCYLHLWHVKSNFSRKVLEKLALGHMFSKKDRRRERGKLSCLRVQNSISAMAIKEVGNFYSGIATNNTNSEVKVPRPFVDGFLI